MNRIPKCRSKYYISQPIKMNPSLKEQPKENMAQKLSKKTLKFTSSRHFGKDITNNIIGIVDESGNLVEIENNVYTYNISLASSDSSFII